MIIVLHWAAARYQIHGCRESKRNVTHIIPGYEFLKILICRPTQSAFIAVGAVEDNRNNCGEQNEKYWGGGRPSKCLVISSTFSFTKTNPHLEPVEVLNARTIAVPWNST